MTDYEAPNSITWEGTDEGTFISLVIAYMLSLAQFINIKRVEH